MNKEEVENIKDDLRTLHKVLWNEHREGTYTIQKILEYINCLEQKEAILDKVTDYIKIYIDDKQNEYEAISESYICQTDEDEYLKEKKLAIIKGKTQVLKNALNIIEGGKKQ